MDARSMACQRCQGTGKVISVISEKDVDCSMCKGTGKIYPIPGDEAAETKSTLRLWPWLAKSMLRPRLYRCRGAGEKPTISTS
jgi:RecJ-like exonuclease